MNHPVWDTYIDLINSDTMYFKYGLLKWCLSFHIKHYGGIMWNDMIDDGKFLKRFTLNQIKEELQNQLNDALENNSKTNEKFLIHNIIEYLNLSNEKSCDQLANKIYDLFIDICENYDKYSCPENFSVEECKKISYIPRYCLVFNLWIKLGCKMFYKI